MRKNTDPLFYGREVAALENKPEDMVTLRLIILGIINNIISNHKEKKEQFLSIIRNLNRIYKQIPENNHCSPYQFELIRNKVTEEIVEYNVRPFLVNDYRQAS